MKRHLIPVSFLVGLAALARAEQQLVHMEVIAPPSIVTTSEGARLAYELHVTNFSNTGLRLVELSILDGQGEVVGHLDTDGLAAATLVVAGDADSRDLQPGRRAVIYLDMHAPGSAPGDTLSHALTAAATAAEGSPATVTGARAVIRTDAPPILGPPLRGGPWIAVYEPGVERGHRRVFYATEGKATLPGRFAVDFIKPDAEGRLSPDDGETPSTYYGFGAPVIAVADGVVVALRDDVADPPSRSGRARHSLGDASGNYVALDIGGGLYAFYEHLKQGAPVEVGDTVEKGDVIGALGFTGSASTPHLHFHIADRPSVLGAEGQPLVFSEFELIGEYPSMGAVGSGPWSRSDAGGPVELAMPGPNSVIMFGE